MPDLLADRVNNEYVKNDEYIQKMIMDQTKRFISNFPDETYNKGVEVTSTLKVKFNELYEDFRSSIEQIISNDHKNELAQAKSFEVIKKYNNMMSYLRSIIKIENIQQSDEDYVEQKFQDLIPMINIVINIATENNFIDIGELEAMRQEIMNKSYNTISAQKSSIIDKNISMTALNDTWNNIGNIIDIIRQNQANGGLTQDQINRFVALEQSYIDPNSKLSIQPQQANRTFKRAQMGNYVRDLNQLLTTVTDLSNEPLQIGPPPPPPPPIISNGLVRYRQALATIMAANNCTRAQAIVIYNQNRNRGP